MIDPITEIAISFTLLGAVITLSLVNFDLYLRKRKFDKYGFYETKKFRYTREPKK